MSVFHAAKLVLAGRGRGYLADDFDERDLLYSAPRAVEPLPQSFTLEPHAVERFDQGATNSCVAHGFAHAIVIRESLKGLLYEEPSRLFLYATSRAYHGGQKLDRGTYPRTMAKALTKVGVPPASAWPFNVSKVNKSPPPQAYLRGHSRRGGSYQRIAVKGDARLDAVCSAIAAELPVVIGTLVDRPFQALKGPRRVTQPASASVALGGHMMCIVGYRNHGASFEVLNSYGRAWRDGGVCEIDADYVAWEHTQDLIIIDGWAGLGRS